MMKRILIVAIFVFSCITAQSQLPFDLQPGDLLFQVNGSSSYTDAIRNVTSGVDGLNFTHVGVALVENGEAYVLEAVPYGVVKSKIDKFFKQSMMHEGNPVVAVGRLKPRYQKIIPDAVAHIELLLGKRYDFLFKPDDDTYYCSEIIYISYLKPNGAHIFKTRPMTFADKQSGQTSPLWEKHFKMHKSPIPEGVEGTNPGDMSRSRAIRIVHRYF